MVIRFLLYATMFVVVTVGHHAWADELPPVFDGKSLDNWTLQNGKPVPSGWEVVNGTIHRKPSKKRTGHIVTRHEYGDFDLSFEWKISKNGNSGLKYRVRKYGRKMLGCEYQIHDHGEPADVPGNKHTGALYDLYKPDPKRQINPSGEFNASRIVVRGDHFEHWLNGMLIMSATVGSPEWEKRIASSKFDDVPDFGRNRLGRIMLTDHGAEVWYRNFKITAPKAEKRPNIVFLFADDQRADTIAAHGNAHIQTPNLDRLAKEGFSFRQNYCAGSFSGAVCVASRAMLMTGRHWMNLPKNKPQSNWGDSTVLPALLAEQGDYNSFIIGKWHNGRGTLEKSFSNGRSVYMGGMANHADFQVQDLADGKLGAKRDAGGFSSTVFADEAVEFIQTAKNDQPFFLYVAFMAPHDPRNPPEKYRKIYYEKRPPLPANFLPQHPFQNAPQSTSGRDEGLAPWPRTKEVIGDQLCEYYGLVTHLDEQVGRVLDALKKSPQADNTIVIYTADHGLAMGSHGLLGKQNVYEQSMRCPLILSGPGIPKGTSSNAMTYVHDLYATICDFAKLPTPDRVDSRSLTSIMNGKKTSVRDSLFLPFQDNQRAVRDDSWKLHVYPKINHSLLFDLSNDPHEMTNLAADPDSKADLDRMQKLMDSWRTKLADPYPLSVKNPEPKEPQYDNNNRVLDVWQPKWIRDKYFGGRDDPTHGNRPAY